MSSTYGKNVLDRTVCIHGFGSREYILIYALPSLTGQSITGRLGKDGSALISLGVSGEIR